MLPYGDFFVELGGEGEMELKERVSDTLFEIMNKEDHEFKLVEIINHKFENLNK